MTPLRCGLLAIALGALTGCSASGLAPPPLAAKLLGLTPSGPPAQPLTIPLAACACPLPALPPLASAPASVTLQASARERERTLVASSPREAEQTLTCCPTPLTPAASTARALRASLLQPAPLTLTPPSGGAYAISRARRRAPLPRPRRGFDPYPLFEDPRGWDLLHEPGLELGPGISLNGIVTSEEGPAGVFSLRLDF